MYHPALKHGHFDQFCVLFVKFQGGYQRVLILVGGCDCPRSALLISHSDHKAFCKGYQVQPKKIWDAFGGDLLMLFDVFFWKSLEKHIQTALCQETKVFVVHVLQHKKRNKTGGEGGRCFTNILRRWNSLSPSFALKTDTPPEANGWNLTSRES